MATDRTRQQGMTRRDFASQVGAAAGLAIGAGLVARPAYAAQSAARVLGANDRVVLGSIGIRGQGNGMKRAFARLDNVSIKTLADIDGNLEASRVNDPQLANVPAYKPNFVQDFRRMLDDPEIDGVIIATPNHWHALATIWALQAGKHVYVEKPSSHTVWEGRRMVEAAARYNRLVQVGTMNRSRPAVRDAIKFLHEGGLGKLHMARGLCFKPRPSIGRYPDGPMAPGEKFALTTTSTAFEPTYDAAYLSKVDYDMWLGPAPKRPFNRNRFHYNWHWHWDYGNADSGNQGPHQFDIARWGLGKQEHPVRIQTIGGLFGPESSQETPNMETSLFEYADGTVLEFGTRGGLTNDEGGQRIGNLFYGEKGWLSIDETGRKWQAYFGPKNDMGPGTEAPGVAPAPAGHPAPHPQNFIDAIRANDAKVLTCDAFEGHLSSALPHLGNIAYRVKRALTFDGKAEKFVDDREADRLLTREYRAGFEVPRSF